MENYLFLKFVSIAVATALAILFTWSWDMDIVVKYPRGYVRNIANRYFDSEEFYPLKNKSVIVTDCSSELGIQLAGELYSLGANVMMTYSSHNVSSLLESIESFRHEHVGSPGNMEALELDFSDWKAVDEFAKYVLSHEPSIELYYLINSFGNNELSRQHYLGTFLLIRRLLPLMASVSNRGRVVNLASYYHSLADGTFIVPVSSHGDAIERIDFESAELAKVHDYLLLNI